MPWDRLPVRPRSSAPLSTPLSGLDPSTLEVVELDPAGRLVPASPAQPSFRELPYAPRGRDPGSLAGLWEGLRSALHA